MHILQPKHSKLRPEEVVNLLERYNISLSQLPKIKLSDVALPPDCKIGDAVKIERKEKLKTIEYFRVVVA